MKSSIYSQLLDKADGILLHYTEDLTQHDRRTLQSIKPGTTWLWIVHSCGTHLARWDEDPYANSKQSHLECLIRAGLRLNWPVYKAYLFYVTEQPGTSAGAKGELIGPVFFESLQKQLPRPKPKVLLPKESQVYSAAFGFASI
jgi:hypothetical protein